MHRVTYSELDKNMHSRLQQQTMCPLTISVVMKTFSSEHHYQGFVVHPSKVVQLENNISPHFGLVTRKKRLPCLSTSYMAGLTCDLCQRRMQGTYQQHQRKFPSQKQKKKKGGGA